MFGFFKKLLSSFSGTLNDATFERLEQIFYEADLGAALSAELVDKIRIRYRKDPKISTDQILAFVKQELLQVFKYPPPIAPTSPHVILLVGVNGSGKTTTLAKLAFHYARQKKKVLATAGDTFRAAAGEQLGTWAKRVGIDLIQSQPNSDPSGVAFDALVAAKARGIDIVLIDTAGRLQTKTDLMRELAKIRTVCQKQISDAPHETLFVLDATTGQNGIDQAHTFHQFTPISGIVLTKLDGSAKGGIAIAIHKQLNLPIQWVGTGEKMEDLIPFEPASYVEAMFCG